MISLDILKQFYQKKIEIEVSGKKRHSGILVDLGQDLFVIFNGEHFIYIPLNHVQRIEQDLKDDSEITNETKSPFEVDNQMTYRKVLNNAKGTFVEIYIGDKISVHGYFLSILTDYFVFYSPLYGMMFIPLFHLKWIIPYKWDQIPYLLENKSFPVRPNVNISFARTFKEQLKKLEEMLVVFDIGTDERKIGLLSKVDDEIIELILAKGTKVYRNIKHIKSVHSPDI